MSSVGYVSLGPLHQPLLLKIPFSSRRLEGLITSSMGLHQQVLDLRHAKLKVPAWAGKGRGKNVISTFTLAVDLLHHEVAGLGPE